MARLARVEDRPTPPEVYNWKVYFNAIIATWAAVIYDSAFIGTSISLASFKSEFGLTTKSTTDFNFISANIVSMLFWAFVGYLVGYVLGRKYGLLLSSGHLYSRCWSSMWCNSSTGLGIMYAGRIIPIYVAEIAPPAIRGRLIGMYELCWQIGGVVAQQWFIAFAVQLISYFLNVGLIRPGAFLFIGSFFLVESPRRDQKSRKLRNLPEDAPYVVEEYTEIEAAIAHERGLAGAGFFGPMKTVFASKTLRPTIFKSIGITGGNTGLLTTGLSLLVLSSGSCNLVDTFGRRGVLLIGSIGGAISMYYIGAYIAIAKPAQHPTTKLSSGGQSANNLNDLRWTIFYGPTWNGRRGSNLMGVGAEMFPQHVRTFTQACQAAFIITRFTPQMFTSMGYGVYIFFATLMVVSVPYIYFILPETKQVHLSAWRSSSRPGVKPWKAHDIVMARVHETRQLRNEGKDSPSSTSFEKKSGRA
ncbi:MFS quinate transporter QutD, partial [Mycena olivaceomarginata]